MGAGLVEYNDHEILFCTHSASGHYLYFTKSRLNVYFWLWEHLRYQVSFFRHTAVILGAQLKILGVPGEVPGT